MELLPLAKSRQTGNRRQVPRVGGQNTANSGLVFAKFVDGWRNQGGKYGLQEDGKWKWVNHFCRDGIGSEALLKRQQRRTIDLAKMLSGATEVPGPLQLYNSSRFVTGMGLAHGIENGFQWHHTLGVPYLPSSGIKGLIRAWSVNWDGLSMALEDLGRNDLPEPRSRQWHEIIVRLFGSYNPKDSTEGIEPKHKEASMGALIIFDALPVDPVRLVADVITPHDGKWRLKGPEKKDGRPNSPGDWHDPVPVPFLAVERGNCFLFALGATRRAQPGDLELGYALLEAALNWLGAGAKTATGYGQFRREKLIEDAGDAASGSTGFGINTVVQVSPEAVKKKLAGEIGHIIADRTAQGLWKVKAGTPEDKGKTEEYIPEEFLTPVSEG